MRKIVEVLRLSADGRYSHREIARIIHVSPTTVGEIIRRAKLAGVSYPLPTSVSEQTLEAQLYPVPAPSKSRRPEPVWADIHRELRRKGVTLDLLWQEYKMADPAVIPIQHKARRVLVRMSSQLHAWVSEAAEQLNAQSVWIRCCDHLKHTIAAIGPPAPLRWLSDHANEVG